MSEDVLSFLAVIVAYLLGSIPFGVILTKIFGAGDLRSIGSGNIGATNVLRTLGGTLQARNRAEGGAETVLRLPAPARVRLVKGSHIVVPKLYEGDHAFMLQNDDRRIAKAAALNGARLEICERESDAHGYTPTPRVASPRTACAPR